MQNKNNQVAWVCAEPCKAQNEWMQKISLKMSWTKLLKGVFGIGCFEAICNTSTYQILLKEAEVQTTTNKSNLTTSLHLT